jgi:hypothetical protein
MMSKKEREVEYRIRNTEKIKWYTKGVSDGKAADQQRWRKDINLFAYLAIAVTILFGIVLLVQNEKIENQQYWLDHNEEVSKGLLNACDSAYKDLVVEYKQCKAESISRPVITEIQATVCNPRE